MKGFVLICKGVWLAAITFLVPWIISIARGDSPWLTVEWFVAIYLLLMLFTFFLFKVKSEDGFLLSLLFLFFQLLLLMFFGMGILLFAIEFYNSDYVIWVFACVVAVTLVSLFIFLRGFFEFSHSILGRLLFLSIIVVVNILYTGFAFGLVYYGSYKFPCFLGGIEYCVEKDSILALFYVALEGMQPFLNGPSTICITANTNYGILPMLPYFQQLLGVVYISVILAYTFKLFSMYPVERTIWHNRNKMNWKNQIIEENQKIEEIKKEIIKNTNSMRMH